MIDGPQDGEGSHFWERLRRRKVVQWGLAYAAGAWALLQVVGFAADAFGWPALAKQLAMLALATGLPIALVLAWYHGDRGHQRLTRAELAILTLLLLLGSSALWLYGHRSAPTQGTSTPAASTPGTAARADTRPSIAVLPFVNMSSEPANEYLADGIADTLLTMLSQVSDLKVIARTSSFSFKGKNEDVRTIGRLLGVGAVLEGSVQRAHDRLRITTQLINTSDGAHLWAETYDRPADDIFKVQDEIAASVTQALAVALAGKHGPGSIGTTNVAAYDAYLRGKALVEQRQTNSIADAVALLEKAATLDPSFARAWALLAEAYRLSSVNVGGKTIGRMPHDESLRLEERAARRAIEAAPDLGVAHAALATFLAQDADHAAEAWNASERAVALSPNDPEVLLNQSFILRHVRNQPMDAVKAAERAVAIDPRNPGSRLVLATALDAAGDLRGALRQHRDAIRIDPDFVRAYIWAGDTLASMVGQADASARFLRRAEKLDPGSSDIKMVLAYVYAALGMRELRDEKVRDLQKLDARNELLWLDIDRAVFDDQPTQVRAAAERILEAVPDDATAFYALSFLRGTPDQVHAALSRLQSSNPGLPKSVTAEPAVGSAYVCLLVQAGDIEQARSLLGRWEPHWRSLNAYSFIAEAARFDGLARGLACVGRKADALAELEALVAAGYDPVASYMERDAAYDVIRQDPRFRALLNQLVAARTAAAKRFRARPDLSDADIDSLGTSQVTASTVAR